MKNKISTSLLVPICLLSFSAPSYADVVTTGNDNDVHLYLHQERVQGNVVSGSFSRNHGSISGQSYGANDFYITKGNYLLSDTEFISVLADAGVGKVLRDSVITETNNRASYAWTCLGSAPIFILGAVNPIPPLSIGIMTAGVLMAGIGWWGVETYGSKAAPRFFSSAQAYEAIREYNSLIDSKGKAVEN